MPPQSDTLEPPKWRQKLKRLIRYAVWAFAAFVILIALAVLIWLRGALYNRFVRFPREEAALAALRAETAPVKMKSEWNEYHGIIHSHSKYSHDCEVTMEEILLVLKRTGIDFICLSDHCTAGRADFSLQWRGVHEGKLFIPGFEMKDGIMPFGVASGVILSNQTDAAVLAQQIVTNHGLLFYAHPEEPRDWGRSELMGMEIYNVHTDFKVYRGGVRTLLPDLVVNQRGFPDQVFRTFFRRPSDFLKRWDELNRTRHITGVAGNDCHQNTGIRAICTAPDRIRLEDTSPKSLKELQLNWFTRPLARALFGPLLPGRKLFHVQLDPYNRMGTFVNTHVLARNLSEPAVMEALQAGRAFVAFDSLADSAGFLWLATSKSGTNVMGETTSASDETRLHAFSPLPCRFSVIRDGQPLEHQEGRAFTWKAPGPGRYRLEAEVKVREDWIPWVYTNPIWLQ